MTDHPARPRIEPPPQSVTFFVTCLVDQFRPQVGDAVVEVMQSQRIGVEVPPGQTCCGQPAFNSGFRKEAREVASRFLDIFDSPGNGAAPIVCPSGSCTAMVRNYYPVLFRDEPEELERAKRVADRLWEFSEFLEDGIGGPRILDPQAVAPATLRQAQDGAFDAQAGASAQDGHQPSASPSATYHRCCHALRELGIDRQPSALLSGIEGLSLLPMERSEVCCGFGGSFSVKMPDISTAMLDEKLDNVEATGAQRLIAGDTGCIMHMEGGLRRRGSSVQVLHIAELLAESGRQERRQATSTRDMADPSPSSPAPGPAQ